MSWFKPSNTYWYEIWCHNCYQMTFYEIPKGITTKTFCETSPCSKCGVKLR